jgi:hypothetical protein
MRSLLCLLALAVATASCAVGASSAPVETQVDGREVALARVADAVAAVAAAQTDTDPALATALTGARGLDVLVAGLRDPASIDEARDTWPRVDAAVTAVDLAALRPGYRDMAFAVDRARTALARAGEAVGDGPDRSYLTAQDETLRAMRTYARSADALAQVLERHWPTYVSVAALTGPFIEERWLYRDATEAAAAYEVELSPHLDALARAQDEIARFRRARDDAARAVNAASDHAADVFRARSSAGGT